MKSVSIADLRQNPTDVISAAHDLPLVTRDGAGFAQLTDFVTVVRV